MKYRNLSKEEIDKIIETVNTLSIEDLKKEAENSLVIKKQTSNRVTKCNRGKKTK